MVLVAEVGDSTLLVPWLFTSRTRPGAVDREARAWLARGGSWEPFLDAAWETPPTRVPWRLLPEGPVRLVVGETETLDQIVFEEGPRRLEVVTSGPIAEWTGSLGETFLVARGAAVLADRRLPGTVFDLSRARRAESPPPGDWMFLTSGDSVQVVLSGAQPQSAGAPGEFEGWGRLTDGGEVAWPDVAVSWAETRAFERARRDVPVRWSLASGNGEMGGELEVRAAHLEAGEGEGPLLPMEALFEVVGVLRVGGSEFPVRGVVRHVQR